MEPTIDIIWPNKTPLWQKLNWKYIYIMEEKDSLGVKEEIRKAYQAWLMETQRKKRKYQRGALYLSLYL